MALAVRVLAALFTCSCGQQPIDHVGGYASPDMPSGILAPPPEYRGPATVTLHVVEDVDAACQAQGATRPPDWRIWGCHRAGAVWMPLPVGAESYYAPLLDHEIAHARGWSHP